MKLPMRGHYFDGDDLILLLEFLERRFMESDIQETSEAFISLPAFLKVFEKSPYKAEVDLMHPDDGYVTSWSETVQYLEMSTVSPVSGPTGPKSIGTVLTARLYRRSGPGSFHKHRSVSE